MSKAFTRDENDGPDIPDLPPLVSLLPPGMKNYMTADGAKRLREALRQLVETERPALARSPDDTEVRRRLAQLDQRIAQMENSLQTAEVVSPEAGPADVVRFGATVTVRAPDGEEDIYRIVGVDETDAELGWVSWLSPIARALLHARVGQRVRFRFPSGERQLEIVRIAYGEQ